MKTLRLFPLRLLLLVCLCICRDSFAELLSDIEYASVGGESLKLDVNVPEGQGPFPVAILVHGGGWSGGDKQKDITPWFAPLTEAKFTWFSINYRLAPANRWPACFEDVKTAIRWVKAHAAEFKGDPARIAIFGHSAGGHLALLAAATANDDTRVQAAVGYAPVTDFLQDLEARGGLSTSLQALHGRPKQPSPEALKILHDTSVIQNVRPGMCPVLIMQGSADKTVPLQQSLNFQAKLRENGVSETLIVIPGAPHRLTEWDKYDATHGARMVAWLQAVLGAGSSATPALSQSSAAPWIPDNGNGTYTNPVIDADYSDPDVIRVGDDYWMISSSFNRVPGIPILHSRDLVNWTIVNHALPKLVPEGHYSHLQHGCGVWAPSIRFHAGKYWIYYPDPDFGIYVVTATDPRGVWSEPVLVKAGKGLIDTCPFWDEDGKAYLVHAWARSRAGVGNRLTLCRLSDDGFSLLDEGQVIIDADKLPGWRTLEGPKFYKRKGWYYVFAPAGGVRGGYQAVFRSRAIQGPYEARIVLDQGRTPINGPHQGAWVDTPKGEHWFLHFQELNAYGRVVHLQPMRWTDDDWVVVGTNPDAEGKSEPVLRHAKPALPLQPIAVPATSDDFIGPSLGLQWQWQANPQAGWASFPGKGEGLRLACVPLENGNSHFTAGHLLSQKFPARAFVATTRLGLDAKADGDRAGLMISGFDYAWIGIVSMAGQNTLVMRSCLKADQGAVETTRAELPLSGNRVWLRVTVTDGAHCRFSYSADGQRFIEFGEPFTAQSGRWIGSTVGLFASSVPGAKEQGSATAAFFRISR
jgi:beta-xylosidase/acetyl esterase/lipase